MKTYITFGSDHVHTIGGVTFDKDSIAVLNHPEVIDGRELAFSLFGDKFCFEYPEEHFHKCRMEFFPRGVVEVPGC